MAKYRIVYQARKRGALGVPETLHLDVTAREESEAIERVIEHAHFAGYEHVHMQSINGLKPMKD